MVQPGVAHFRIGQKAIYLERHRPTFIVTLLRTPQLPAYYARFQVPLSLNKLDLRDYLWHGYGVRVLSVRSFIKQLPVGKGQRQDVDKGIRARSWYRPKSLKYMTVEMDRPFVWPEVPSDYSVFEKSTFDAAQSEREDAKRLRKRHGFDPIWPSGERSIAAYAQRLLEGKEKWKPDKTEGAVTPVNA